jgi:hypothetical protein
MIPTPLALVLVPPAAAPPPPFTNSPSYSSAAALLVLAALVVICVPSIRPKGRRREGSETRQEGKWEPRPSESMIMVRGDDHDSDRDAS